MSLIELLAIAIGLSMDAFAVSVTSAMSAKKLTVFDALKFGLFFGGFQALMPFIGWLFGSLFSSYVTAVDHWIAFVLLAYIGGKMIYDALFSKENEAITSFSAKVLLVLAIATSIDALAVGVTFAFIKISILPSVITIGLVTLIISVIGAFIGKKVSGSLGDKAQIIGGIILVLMGIKILIEHLFF